MTRTVHDPFLGKDVEVSDRLVDRLRGKYAMGPHLPNGRPEFGWRQFQAPPIQHEAAAVIEDLVKALRTAVSQWAMYADMNEREDENVRLVDEKSQEGDLYRHCQALLVRLGTLGKAS